MVPILPQPAPRTTPAASAQPSRLASSFSSIDLASPVRLGLEAYSFDTFSPAIVHRPSSFVNSDTPPSPPPLLKPPRQRKSAQESPNSTQSVYHEQLITYKASS